MHSARNFHPEWGYLTPAPNLVRTVRIVLVATVVGATAGASVVSSLVGRPATETSEIPVAARTLVRPVGAASAPLNTPQAAPVSAQAAVQTQSTKPSVADGHEEVIAASESSAGSTAQPPAGIAALIEAPAPTDAAPAEAVAVTMPAAGMAPETGPVPVQKKATKKHNFASRYALRGGPLKLLPDTRWGFY